MKTTFNINNLVRPNIAALKPYSSARDEFKDATSNQMIFLDANENPFENGVNRYPDPQQKDVKSMLSSIKNIPTENILLGNGSDEVLDLIFRAFCEPNQDNIITLPPTYGMYNVLANTNAIDVLTVELNADFQPKVDDILNTQNSNTKLLFLCSPNNPTANSFEASKIEKLLTNFNGIIVIDEAYIDFSEDESWISRLSEFSNLIVAQTLSKAYGMAGIRLGICFASTEIISILNKIKPPYNVNQLTQLKAIQRLEKQQEVQNEIQNIISERSLLIKALASITWIDTIYPTQANFVLVKVDDATNRYNQLVEKGIVVRNRTNQPLCNNCLRFTVGTSEENEKFIAVLKNI
ncbi:histidinol-phosphate aminotransferase [Mesoflavibacter sabulilitoris]|uniref:Histidinol-phosphate aminotransferase n=1 Tax=Mesoflavibacter zeaxanthinifaciens subsp. sabulilitoris TaxID=1520893 RepID=A0A2T1NGK1_9FLAO|nr:histidinol-phosphate transaminase [Mesoflavibacter zeaxanthinifaciens]MBB3122929.1 histidinol-phosphate aminotransferase [Mesoflavibacter zeaxanthinifaciens subsp. sabulilitoris]PSG91997.1 histidinol-phosphate transaminase [Mesoflavibacter zeaxanthinifaciens subsp. sabulilitoris]